MEVMIVMIKLYVRIQKVVIHVHVIKDTQELVSYVQVCFLPGMSILPMINKVTNDLYLQINLGSQDDSYPKITTHNGETGLFANK